ncbi:YqgE/AlgH family protein [Patulibacter americanus]|jgi:putative transcriptional regulator|uniref:YqgE/AlgH family protein n=1 Tax=Patulibacter americanus TaxID=588672 RepID=UPI0003B582CD|nr:YqgE/AlgH family protein [Patulibacter americanus]
MARRLSGQLLVASPTIGDANFARTVVLIVDHDRDGALGIVLNRPTETAVEAVVPDIAPMFAPDDVVHDGGPVQPDSLLTVAEFRDPADAALLVLGRIGMVRGDEDPRCPDVDRARAYAGYAGWAPEQLDAELEAADWLVVPAQPDDLFVPDASRLWHLALERMGGPYALLAHAPEDPSVN